MPSTDSQTRKSFQEWLDETNRSSARPIIIRDYDGLDRTNLQHELHSTPMTEQEFQKRLTKCSFNIRP
ncbi:MAG: hypothetical protein ACKOD5_07970 [Chthoniobacterales bacterium]